MCLGIPALVLDVNEDENWALVDSNGAVFKVHLHILDEEVKKGDYVMVHAGFAIGKIEKEDAKMRLEMLREIIYYGR
ncbi:MAG: HypC/HybG/HupF family hydrogenase formation chaperone [Desulfobacterota bacterium]|nr:HypC/HybG/HupF family hydrogenase formation chaperone [Thermodesulfobacteriota bacterium]MDW8001523.1 HypC/HybG/HupF family hydrogenase formation chaperone [Deltaproteobacteria bacterium]